MTPNRLGGRDGYQMPGGKNAALAKLQEDLNLRPENVLFFDDDRNNIREALDAGYPHAIHCAEGFVQPFWLTSVGQVAAHAAAEAAAAAPGNGGSE